MNRTTLRDVRLSRIPETLGLCAGDNALLIQTVNEAQHRLLIDAMQPDEGWWGTWAVMQFNLTGSEPYFTLPRGVARVTAVDVCKRPVPLRNQFYEYLDFGNGLRPSGCPGRNVCQNLMAFDRGPVVTFIDIDPPNKKLRVYSTNAADEDTRVLVSGKDAFGNVIHSQNGLEYVSGEFITLAAPFSDSVNEFIEISGIQKDVTTGAIQFFEVDTATGDQRLLLTMEPGETSACYHRYFVNGLPGNCCGEDGVPVSALVKLEFFPVSVETDFLTISNLPALKEECQAVRMGEMDSMQAKQAGLAHHANALRLLFGELDHYVGKERVSISVPIFGSNKLRKQPI